jgi:hypothetical protein
MIGTSPAVTPSSKPPTRRRRKRPPFTDAEIADIVRRYETETARKIAFDYDCHMSTVARIVRMHCGKNSADCKRGTQLTADEQAYITANFRTMTMAAICRHLGRSKKAVRTFARKTGLAHQPTRRVDGDRLVVDTTQYQADRTKRLVRATVEIHRACKRAGVDTANTPLRTLALKLVRAKRWRPANSHVAADLGDDGLFTPRPASEPCEALPGSLERVEAYAARVERGEEIWCERDRRD